MKCEWCDNEATRTFVVREFKQRGALKQVKANVCDAHYRRFNELRDQQDEAKRKQREEARKRRGR